MTSGQETTTYRGRERRLHNRYAIQDDALVFIGKETGTIIDMSIGGVAVRFVSMKQEVPPPKQLDLFLARSQFYLPNLPIMLVNALYTPPYSPFSSLFGKRLCFQFGPLNNKQQSQIKRFIHQHRAVSP
ncbi:PilZ domain-containing protein [Desulfobulbus propionicus]